MDSSTSPTLTTLLPSTPYLLAYVLPLLLLSILLTFAGTFLTLDRTRSFPKGPGYAAIPAPGGYDLAKKKSKFVWQLQGGVGGLAGGYTFGLHFATALALLIPATTKSPTLSSGSFLAVWILSCAVTTWLAGRYRYAALGLFAVSGGTLSALALCVIIHPSLSSRVILVAVFLPLFSIICLAASVIPRLSFLMLHSFMRLCTSTLGAFGVVVAISLLLRPQVNEWANVWERLWMKDGEKWGSGKEQGLSAAFGVFVALGCLSDWALKRWIGECPDEKWDNYLAHYAANLPNQPDRAGTFQPLASFWERLFPSRDVPFPHPKANSTSKDIIFPSDAELKGKLPLPITMNNVGGGKLSKVSPDTGAAFVGGKDLLKKSRSRRKKAAKGGQHQHRGGRKPVKFGALEDLSSDSSDDDDGEDSKPLSASSTPVDASPEIQHKKPPRGLFGLGRDALTRTHSSAAATLVDGEPGGPRAAVVVKDDVVLESLDYDAEIARLKQQRRSQGKEGSYSAEYSDYEEDLTAHHHHQRQHQHQHPQQQRKMSRRDSSSKATSPISPGWTPGFLRRHQSTGAAGAGGGADEAQLLHPPGAMPVPATPSLIKALDRIRVAQEDAYGPLSGGVSGGGGGMGRRAPTTTTSAAADPERDVGMTRLGNGHERRKSGERVPRWDEFWREVRTKAAS